MRADPAQLIQSLFNRAGFQIRRVERGVSYGDPLAELSRLAGNDVRQIVEVGAADGRDTLRFAEHFPNATVTAFEPLPENFEKLAAVARTHDRIAAVNSAVSDKAGQRTFYMTKLPDASSLFKPQATGSTFDRHTTLKGEISVECVCLDQCSSLPDAVIDILKLDVQGAELAVLRGAEQSLRAKRVRVIFSEVNFIRIYEGAALFHEVASHLEKLNYRLHNLYNLVHNQNGQLAWGDAIFVPEAQ